MHKFLLIISGLSLLFANNLSSQIIINEGSNKNYSTLPDEDGEFQDWIELYNSGTESVDLFNYSISDDPTNPTMWTLPHYFLNPGEFLVIHCSGKNRFATPAATVVHNSGSFVATTGWNTHYFSTPFIWDGYSNVMVNVCSFSSLGYTVNSVFNQSYTTFNSTNANWADGSPASCSFQTGNSSNMRPNIQLNGYTIGTDVVQNCNTCYPAPYGNWYWGARNQMLFHADELTASGLIAGPIDSLAFDVVYPDGTTYDYIEISMNNVSDYEFNGNFINNSGSLFHSNFKISSGGEIVYLYAPDQTLSSSLSIGGDTYDMSNGSFPDGDNFTTFFQPPTPGFSNNGSDPCNSYALPPVFSIASGFFSTPFNVTITNPNGTTSTVYYTTDGSYPTVNSNLYDGTPIQIFTNTTLRAKAFEVHHISSEPAVATYFYNVNHITPIISVTTDNANLYGSAGIFDNYNNDWLKESYVEYFDSIPTHPLLFSQESGLIQDGGWGGSRSQPQHSFRLELANNLLGGDPMHYPVIPDRPNRDVFSDFYLRNGSNQYLVLPYKDACQVKMMTKGLHGYYSAYRPVSVYINSQYFGLYELREKFNKEKFVVEDNATPSTVEILSLSAFYGFVLRAVEGDVNNFWNSYNAFAALDPASNSFWSDADALVDLEYYSDYIIGESWMGNVDWPGNNIKIYRSDATDYRWRFCTIDLELALQPNAWTDCYSDNMAYILSQGEGNPYTFFFNRSLNNSQFRTYFVNRYADVLNTAYQTERLLAIEQNFFDQTVTEMQNEYQRWGDPWNVPSQIQNFYNNHLTFRSELECRNTQIRDHIQNNLGLDGQVNVTLNVYPEGAGTIQISTIVPESLPWTGIYFNGVPVTITATANPGFTFDHWLSDVLVNSPYLESSLTLNISEDDQFTAYFSGLAIPTEISISEINYNSDNTQYCGDWFEVHNYGAAAVDLSGWKVTNEIGIPDYTIPSGVILNPDEYLVFIKDIAAFQSIYPAVNNFVGPFNFSLSGSGGTIRLINAMNQEYLAVTYDDVPNWPVIADGGGRTLEIAVEANDPNSPDNWFAGCMLGSPGEAYHPCPEKLMFTEINYESSSLSNSGDWVELRNTGNQPMDISNWIFRDDNDNSLFQIPANTILEEGEMLVLNNDNALFQQQYPDVTNHVGPFNFNLNNSGEFLRLYNDQDKLYFSMLYGAGDPWPATPNGDGYTLELIDSSQNVNAASNWMAGCLYGSPGVYYTPCTTIDVTESTQNNSLLVYPNPTNGMTYLVSPKPLSTGTIIQIIDPMGRILNQQKLQYGKSYVELDLSDFATGWYMIQTSGDEGVFVQKILKQ